jgi:hypothetical protein
MRGFSHFECLAKFLFSAIIKLEMRRFSGSRRFLLTEREYKDDQKPEGFWESGLRKQFSKPAVLFRSPEKKADLLEFAMRKPESESSWPSGDRKENQTQPPNSLRLGFLLVGRTRSSKDG